MSKGSVLFVSYLAYPSREVGAKRPSETALHLARSGYEVTMLRARARDEVTAGNALPGVTVIDVTIPRRLFTALYIRLKTILKRARDPANADPLARMGNTGGDRAPEKLSPLQWLRRQVLAWDTLFQGNKRWLLVAVAKLRLSGRRYDVVIGSGPPMVSYICAWAASRFAARSLILDYRDPWYVHGDPELTTIMLGHPLARFENGLANRCAMDCAALVTASAGTKRHILEHFDVAADRVTVIRNGFDTHARIATPLPLGRLDVLYAGSLYWNRNPFPFLEALRDLIADGGVDRERVRVRFVGHCERWQDRSLQPWLEANGLDDIVHILPFVSPPELATMIADSNVLVNFAQGQPRQIPAKSYDYIAAGREVLVIAEADGDVADLFREAGLGRVVEPNDPIGMRDALLALYGKLVKSAAHGIVMPDIEPYSREVQVERYETLIEGVIAAAHERAHR